ncbi:MAG: apolipoprotein N-acyltransferase [Armatimonadota bacterium]
MSRKTPTLKQQQTARTFSLFDFLWLMPVGGVALALGFPNDLLPGTAGDRPFFPVAWVALVPLLWAIQVLPAKTRYWAAYLYGAGFGLCTVAWMRLFGYVPWFLLALAYFAIFFPLALFAADRLALRRFLPLAFALAYTGLEWARGQGMFGFPWSELGSSQVEGATARIASVGGIPLITFLLLWVTGAAVQAVRERRAGWQLPASVGALAVCLLAGFWQTRATSVRWEGGASRLRVSVVQPNVLRGLTPADLVISPSPEELRRRTNKMVELSYEGAANPRPPGMNQLIVWPESAMRNGPFDSAILRLNRATGSYLLLGAPGYPRDWKSRSYYNSAHLLDPRSMPVERHDKMHLVPFGEFVPMRALVDRFYIVRKFDILPGTSHAPLRKAGMALGVGICFESIFPAISRTYADQGAELLVFITNDAWFHVTAAGRQHFNHARFRALETGLPVARSASTGISGFIAPDGRILSEIPTDQEGVKTRDLPPGIPGTLYTRGGWIFGPACLVLMLALFVAGIIRARRRQP